MRKRQTQNCKTSVTTHLSKQQVRNLTLLAERVENRLFRMNASSQAIKHKTKYLKKSPITCMNENYDRCSRYCILTCF